MKSSSHIGSGGHLTCVRHTLTWFSEIIQKGWGTSLTGRRWASSNVRWRLLTSVTLWVGALPLGSCGEHRGLMAWIHSYKYDCNFLIWYHKSNSRILLILLNIYIFESWYRYSIKKLLVLNFNRLREIVWKKKIYQSIIDNAIGNKLYKNYAIFKTNTYPNNI